jgi:PAS domain S-box-containing protein
LYAEERRERRVLDASALLIRKGNADPTGFRAIVRDITDRKRMEDALRESEERYRTVLDEMEEGYQEVDLAGNFTFFNEAFLKIFGYSREEMLGTNYSVYAADEEIAKRIYRAYNEMYKTGVSLKSCEWDVIRKDGARRTLEFSASLLRDSNGRPTGFRGIVRDVTEHRRAVKALKESEEKYRSILENMNDGIFEADLRGNLTFFNPMLPKFLGYTREEMAG